MRSVWGSQSALCKQASSWSGQVAGRGGGVLHGPLGLSAEQITDGRNVAFVLKKRENRVREARRRRSSANGKKRGPPINIYLRHSYCRASGCSEPCSCISPGRRLAVFLGLCSQTPDLTTVLRHRLDGQILVYWMLDFCNTGYWIKWGFLRLCTIKFWAFYRVFSGFFLMCRPVRIISIWLKNLQLQQVRVSLICG